MTTEQGVNHRVGTQQGSSWKQRLRGHRGRRVQAARVDRPTNRNRCQGTVPAILTKHQDPPEGFVLKEIILGSLGHSTLNSSPSSRGPGGHRPMGSLTGKWPSRCLCLWFAALPPTVGRKLWEDRFPFSVSYCWRLGNPAASVGAGQVARFCRPLSSGTDKPETTEQASDARGVLSGAGRQTGHDVETAASNSRRVFGCQTSL